MLAVLSTPWFRVPVLAVVVVTVQTVVISQVHLLGASPDLVVLCAVVGGLVGGPQRGHGGGLRVRPRLRPRAARRRSGCGRWSCA